MKPASVKIIKGYISRKGIDNLRNCKGLAAKALVKADKAGFDDEGVEIRIVEPIKYPSKCYYCGKICEVEKDSNKRAFLQRVKGKWFAHCRDCYDKKKE